MRRGYKLPDAILLLLAMSAGACSSSAAVRPAGDAGDAGGDRAMGPGDRVERDTIEEQVGAEPPASDGAAAGDVGTEAGDAGGCQPSVACLGSMVWDPVRCACAIPPETSCAETLDAYCAADGGVNAPCVRAWSATPDTAKWCRSAVDRLFVYPACDGFNLIVRAGVDTAVVYYYDPGTLQLVRVESTNGINARCDAGTPGVVVPQSDCKNGGFVSCAAAGN